jgi:hypothetical protein
MGLRTYPHSSEAQNHQGVCHALKSDFARQQLGESDQSHELPVCAPSIYPQGRPINVPANLGLHDLFDAIWGRVPISDTAQPLRLFFHLP